MALVDESDTRNMVLRTVFLPPALDDQLRDVAFHLRVSKGDLIRSLVLNGLAALDPQSPAPSRASKKRVTPKKASPKAVVKRDPVKKSPAKKTVKRK